MGGSPEDTWDEDMFEWAAGRAEYVVTTVQERASAAYISNCRSHDTIDKLDFHAIEIEDVSIREALYAFAEGTSTPWYFDTDYYPDGNPSCPFDQLEWNTLHCGEWWISDCEDGNSTSSLESI